MSGKVLFVSDSDWANVSYHFQESLKRVGVDALAVTKNPHGFHYKNEATCLGDWGKISSLFRGRDIIIYMHSHINQLIKPIERRAKRYGVFHGGETYRRAIPQLNEVFNFVDFSLIQTGDLLGKGAIREHWMIPAIDTDSLKPVKEERDGPLVVAHYPRSMESKNSVAINRVMDEMVKRDKNKTFIYKFDETQAIPWEKNIERMQECDIYIDNLTGFYHGNWVGEWGVQTMEAAAMGKIVLTMFTSSDMYRPLHGVDHELVPIADQIDLYLKLSDILAMSREDIEAKKKATRRWIREQHSYRPTGNRLKKIMEIS